MYKSITGLWHPAIIAVSGIGLTLLVVTSSPAVAAGWRAGIARRVITPDTDVWLAGYGTKRPPDGKIHDLWMKALALQDADGRRAVLITSDFQGVPKSMSDPVFDELRKQFGLDRRHVMFTFSHNHCGPRLGDDLVDYYPVDPDQVVNVQKYTYAMQRQAVEMVGEALANLQPATIAVGAGHASFAVNRRNNVEAEVAAKLEQRQPLRGPVDHTVPVLRVSRSCGEPLAILFGYACHPTTLNFNTWCGDYPGFAQLQLERRFPGATAMFVNTCGGDQNPLPRRQVELCQRYGEQLAVAVERALAQPLRPVTAKMATAFEVVELSYLHVVDRAELQRQTLDSNPVRARWANRLLQESIAGATFAPSYPYPVHAWRLGEEVLLIGMGAETVVDYALRFKQEFGPRTWVCGYADDMIAYIPSRRVWEEGGYEGGSSLYEYGRPAYRWSGDIEERIAACVHRLVQQVGPPKADVGVGKQLFVDDHVVETTSRVQRQLGPVSKHNGGRPIFTDGWFYGTVLYDEGEFKLWYRKPGTQGYGFAESADGLLFAKRADVVGIPFAGDFTLAVELDPVETDPAHRFKAGFDGPGMAAGIAHSADGIHWTPYHDGRAVTERAADTYNQIFWDGKQNVYRLMTRSDFGAAGGTAELRGTRCMINPSPKYNASDWRTLRAWKFEGEGNGESARRQIYAATCWIYHDVYFGLLSVYEYPGDLSEGTITDHQQRHERDIMNAYLATSRDGLEWDLTWVYAERPLIPRGPAGSFDKDLILPASTIVTHADRHWIYYAGANERHGTEQHPFERRHAIGLATVPLDRFIGLTAGADEGTIITKPFQVSGDRLTVNVDARGGSLDVELLDAAGVPIPQFTRADSVAADNVDSLRWEIRWSDRRDLSSLPLQTVRIKFYLRNATVYAWECRAMEPQK